MLNFMYHQFCTLNEDVLPYDLLYIEEYDLGSKYEVVQKFMWVLLLYTLTKMNGVD